MKINISVTWIILILSSLLGYLVFSIADSDPYAKMASIISAVCFTFPLIMGGCVQYRTSVSLINVRVVSFVFFLVMLIFNFFYAYTGISMPSYVLINGILICIYALIIYAVIKSKQ